MSRPRNYSMRVYHQFEGALQKWFGYYHAFDGTRRRKRTLVLGYTSEMSEEEAQAALRAIIKREEFQALAVCHLGSIPSAIHPKLLGACERKAGNEGAAAEMIVAADLLLRGFEVYRPVSPQASCDLLYFECEDTVRVEVKSAIGNQYGTMGPRLARNAGKFDVLAVVLPDGSVQYHAHSELRSGDPFVRELAGSSQTFLAPSTGDAHVTENSGRRTQ